MAARGFRRVKRSEASVGFDRFVCDGCRRPLELDRVLHADVDRVADTATGRVAFDHTCECTSDGLLTSRGWGSCPAFVDLFGRLPTLPYHSPFPARPVAADDPMIRRWRWELSEIDDVAEFLLFVNDAVRRR